MGDHPVAPEARALTPEEVEERTATAHAADRQLRSGLQNSAKGLWQAAEGAYHLHHVKGWRLIGYDKLNDYLAENDIGLARAVFFRMVDAWHRVVVVGQTDLGELPELPMTKVDTVLPAVKAGKVTLTEALGDVKSMGRRDLRDVYIGGRDPDDPPTDPADESRAGATNGAAPINDGSEAPVRASDGAEVKPKAKPEEPEPDKPAHNDPTGESGQLPDVEGTATDVEPEPEPEVGAAGFTGKLPADYRPDPNGPTASDLLSLSETAIMSNEHVMRKALRKTRDWFKAAGVK